MSSLSTAGKVVFTVIGAIAIIGATTTTIVVKALQNDKEEKDKISAEEEGEKNE